jgi:hypothetical protein
MKRVVNNLSAQILFDLTKGRRTPPNQASPPNAARRPAGTISRHRMGSSPETAGSFILSCDKAGISPLTKKTAKEGALLTVRQPEKNQYKYLTVEARSHNISIRYI